MSLFRVVFFTNGVFVKGPKLRYGGGKIYAYKELDMDMLSYFEACEIIKQMDSTFDELLLCHGENGLMGYQRMSLMLGFKEGFSKF